MWAVYGGSFNNMTLLEMYEKVNLTLPLEQRRFFNYFNDSSEELLSLYGNFALEKDVPYKAPESLSDNIAVRALYHTAIVDNILFLAGQGDAYKSEFLRKAHNAYLKYWNENARGRKLKTK